MELYAILKHSHTLLVTLFVLSFLIKTYLLLTNKQASLANYRKKMLVPEMIISVLFLIVGIWMMVLARYYVEFNWFWIKLILVLATIPLGIVAFKRNNKALALLTLLIFLFILIYAFIR